MGVVIAIALVPPAATSGWDSHGDFPE
ncbi:hypothetical protein [Methanosarcina horonobensis]|nr:hypothetical protein [Methanosarcina horonobensis]